MTSSVQQIKDEILSYFPDANVDHLGSLDEALATLPPSHASEPLLFLTADFIDGDSMLVAIPTSQFDGSPEELLSEALSRRHQQGLSTKTISPHDIQTTVIATSATHLRMVSNAINKNKKRKPRGNGFK